MSKEEIWRIEVAGNKPLIFPEWVRESPQEQGAWEPMPREAVRIKRTGWELGSCLLWKEGNLRDCRVRTSLRKELG